MSSGALRGIGDVSPERFAEHYVEVGQREGILHDATIDNARFVVIAGGNEHDLAPIYERFLALPAASRRYFLLRVLRGVGVTPHFTALPYELVRDRLLPRLRSATFLDIAALDDTNRGRPPQLVYAPFAGDVYQSVVIDSEDRMTAVTSPMLEQWNLGIDDVLQDACDNLRRLEGEPLAHLSRGFWMGPWDDGYAVSRALLPDQLTICEEPIVALPNRDTLLVADATQPAALSALVSLVANVADTGHALSRDLFRLADGVLHPWTLPTTHDAALKHRRMCVAERVRAYGEQQWVLQESVGHALYVASAELDETKDGSLATRALWTEGTAALLPEVDRVHLLSAAEDGTSSRIVVADFDALRDLDGVLQRTPNLLPRWRTQRFPTDAELNAIAVPVTLDPGTASVSDPGRRS